MRNLLNKWLFIRSRFARPDEIWGRMISMYWNESQCTIQQKTFSRDRLQLTVNDRLFKQQ
jgi:hypothetical protein